MTFADQIRAVINGEDLAVSMKKLVTWLLQESSRVRQRGEGVPDVSIMVQGRNGALLWACSRGGVHRARCFRRRRS